MLMALHTQAPVFGFIAAWVAGFAFGYATRHLPTHDGTDGTDDTADLAEHLGGLLASLSLLYELPVLLVISWRGEGGQDAPEHGLMGQVTDRLLDTIGVPHQLLDPARLDEQVAAAAARLDETRRPVALIVRKGILE